MNKKSVLFSVLLGLAAQAAHARISSFSQWGYQDRLATMPGNIDQSVGFQFGLNGVSPAGFDTDTKFISVPYQITYGLRDKLEVGASWGLQWLDRKNISSQSGVQDLLVGGRYRFFDANRSEHMPGLDFEAAFSLPTASFEKGLGTGAFGVLFNWGIVLPLDPARAQFGIGYRINTENSDDYKVGNVFSYNMGCSIPLKNLPYVKVTGDSILVTGEIKGFNHARNQYQGVQFGPSPDELYLAPGAVWKINDRMQLTGEFLIGLTTDSSDLGITTELRF